MDILGPVLTAGCIANLNCVCLKEIPILCMLEIPTNISFWIGFRNLFLAIPLSPRGRDHLRDFEVFSRTHHLLSQRETLLHTTLLVAALLTQSSHHLSTSIQHTVVDGCCGVSVTLCGTESQTQVLKASLSH